jgi:hypothetical protein
MVLMTLMLRYQQQARKKIMTMTMRKAKITRKRRDLKVPTATSMQE